MNLIQRVSLVALLWGMFGLLLVAIGSKVAQNETFIFWVAWAALTGTVGFIVAAKGN